MREQLLDRFLARSPVDESDGGCHVGDDGRDAFGLAVTAFPWN